MIVITQLKLTLQSLITAQLELDWIGPKPNVHANLTKIGYRNPDRILIKLLTFFWRLVSRDRVWFHGLLRRRFRRSLKPSGKRNGRTAAVVFRPEALHQIVKGENKTHINSINQSKYLTDSRKEKNNTV